ncbi:MAG: tagatose 3-epimerase [Cyclobacteriaceae bacterium]|nr:MAG: tagatose 3-epimerase [Cyclobacteriaceae bacterium]
MKVKLGVSTWLWTSPFNPETIRLFPKIKSMGFSAVEIPVEDPALIDLPLVKQALHENELEAVICGAFGAARDLTHEDPSIHQNCFRYIEACFAISQALNCSFVAGPMYSAVGKARLLPDDQRQKEWDLAVTNLRKVCQMADLYGQQIALEPLNRFETDLVNTAEDVVRLVRDINHPAAKILLDSFHMSLEEKNLRDAIEAAAQDLIHVQVSENYRGIPGTGQTCWKDIKAGLESIGYQETVCIESFTPEVKELAGAVCIWKKFSKSQDHFAEQGIQFLQELFRD